MITKEQAIKLQHGDIIFKIGDYNADGTAMRWRVNGKCKLWKTRPEDFSVPLKYGLYSFGHLTPGTAPALTLVEPEKLPTKKRCYVCAEIFQPTKEGDAMKMCRSCIYEAGLTFIIIKDRPNGGRWYWSYDNGWCDNRESATEFSKRPHTLPGGHSAKVFEYKTIEGEEDYA